MSIEIDGRGPGISERSFGLVYEEKPEEFYLDKSDHKPRIGDVILLEDGKEGCNESLGGGVFISRP